MVLYSLMSSLPYLVLFEQPGISREKFLYFCSSYLDGKQMELLTCLSLKPNGKDSDFAALLSHFPERSVPRSYMMWESLLRDSMAKLRAAKRPGFTAPSRTDCTFDGEAENAVHRAYAAANPLEREKILDQARWTKLEELEGMARIRYKHGFHFDALCVYALKLMIAEKWIGRKESGAAEHLNRIAERVQSGTSDEKSENKVK